MVLSITLTRTSENGSNAVFSRDGRSTFCCCKLYQFNVLSRRVTRITGKTFVTSVIELCYNVCKVLP